MKDIPLPTREHPWGFRHRLADAVDPDPTALFSYVELNLTGRCDGGCITCMTPTGYAAEKELKSPADLTDELERFKAMTLRLKTMGLKLMTLYGREPTLWDREAGTANAFLVEFIRWLSEDAEVRVCLCTAGIHLKRPVVETLFEHKGILFMKNWGGAEAVSQLMKKKDAHARMRESWALVEDCRGGYDRTHVVAEFLYTGINRADLQSFWLECLAKDIQPFVEVPVIQGACVETFRKLAIEPGQYVRDIYDLSILHLGVSTGMEPDVVRESAAWYPPYGSVFPMPCEKLCLGYAFLERTGELRLCCGVPRVVGHLDDDDLEERLRNLSPRQALYRRLEGPCGQCVYSREMGRCYGCRGNAVSYNSPTRGFLGEDPMCFGLQALRLGREELMTFMSGVHVDRLHECFSDEPAD